MNRIMYIDPIPKPQRKRTPEQAAHRALLGKSGSKQKQWRKLRDSYLKEHMSEYGEWWRCDTTHGFGCGRLTSSPEVDHIIKRSVDPKRLLDKTNLQILCHECHLKKDFGMKFKD